MGRFFACCIQNNIQLITLAVTIKEYLVFPYLNNQIELADNFKRFLKYMDVQVVNIDAEIAEQAAKIRGHYKNFKAMDALQLASVCIQKCDLFLTNDKQLRQFKEIKCITIDELE